MPFSPSPGASLWAHYQVKPRHYPRELGTKIHGCLDGFLDEGLVFGSAGETERGTGISSQVDGQPRPGLPAAVSQTLGTTAHNPTPSRLLSPS